MFTDIDLRTVADYLNLLSAIRNKLRFLDENERKLLIAFVCHRAETTIAERDLSGLLHAIRPRLELRFCVGILERDAANARGGVSRRFAVGQPRLETVVGI